ncbi:MAG: hypothetical protein M1840_006327 [Geoglossum simile]|nr:MAG: hypothetical protein M1840_006327 [Geoglossum simile]
MAHSYQPTDPILIYRLPQSPSHVKLNRQAYGGFPMAQAKALTWSPLPNILFSEGFSTENESNSDSTLQEWQLEDWDDFETTVRASTNKYLGLQMQVIPTQTEKELICVGNEHGLMSRFGQNVAHVMTEVNNQCGLSIRYGDYQVGRTIGGGYGRGGIPDLILIDSQHGIRAVCEGKTFWTKKLGAVDCQLRATWLGQLARYMDDHHLVFGCYTTYQESIFLKRVSDETFRESPVILHSTASTEIGGIGAVSLRECFLYLAIMASTDSYRYPTRYGPKLTNGYLTPRQRTSPRLLEDFAAMKLKD